MSDYTYDKDEIKNNLTVDQVMQLLSEFGGEPRIQRDVLVSKTICHGGDSHKLYYYDNSHLFHCFTECGESFDIYELVRKIKTRETGKDYPLFFAIQYIAQYFGYSLVNDFEEDKEKNLSLTYLENYDRIKNIEIENQIVELKEYDDGFLRNLPHPVIMPWIEDNILEKIMDYYEICFDPKNMGIVIPHRDINGRLIGVRERTMVKEIEEMYGKYMPMKMGGVMYNHPLSFNLYGLYQNKNNIKAVKKAIVLESEKSVLQYGSMFGQDNNIAVAICGSAFINYQAWLLINLGVKEIVVGLDHDFDDVTDAKAQMKIRNLKNIYKKYGQFVNISFIWDKNNITGMKCSPTDCGKDIFLQLFKERINIYDT